MQSALYRDYDALAYRPRSVGEERGAANHIKKAKQRQKGLEVVFDPKAHKDFVTGFRKRKQQRRKEAEKQLTKKAKEQRVQDRAERRQERKQQLGLPDDYGVQDSDGEQRPGARGPEAAAAKAEVKRYQQGGVTTTVSVINMGDSDNEPQASASVSGSDDERGEQQPQQQRRRLPQQPAAKQRAAATQPGGLAGTQQGGVAKAARPGGGRKSHQKKKKKGGKAGKAG